MNVSTRLMLKHELVTADHIFRLAFGTFAGLPEPTEFYGDVTYIPHRWKSDPTAAFVAEVDAQVIGSNFATNWGSFGFLGPLSLHPDYWNQGIGQKLIEPALGCLEQWNTRKSGVFTFAKSPKHHALYEKFGFRLQFLTVIMAKSVGLTQPIKAETRYSLISADQRLECLRACRELTDLLYEGLDLSREIQTVQAQGLGDTVLLWDDSNLVGFAVCHYGAATEAGSNTCYIKFGAVRASVSAEQHFEELLDLCEALTVAQAMSRLIAGVNTSRDRAYQQMLARGFRVEIIGVAMHKPNESGYNRPDVFVIDDWR